mmetsp:Transcript_15992/g.35593  ORF Transcript_15992/g.35593 Transcript_15992/m.35593 type:complete len:223 (-) Transcript_15992:57-725(-)
MLLVLEPELPDRFGLVLGFFLQRLRLLVHQHRPLLELQQSQPLGLDFLLLLLQSVLVLLDPPLSGGLVVFVVLPAPHKLAVEGGDHFFELLPLLALSQQVLLLLLRHILVALGLILSRLQNSLHPFVFQGNLLVLLHHSLKHLPLLRIQLHGLLHASLHVLELTAGAHRAGAAGGGAAFFAVAIVLLVLVVTVVRVVLRRRRGLWACLDAHRGSRGRSREVD